MSLQRTFTFAMVVLAGASASASAQLSGGSNPILLAGGAVSHSTRADRPGLQATQPAQDDAGAAAPTTEPTYSVGAFVGYTGTFVESFADVYGSEWGLSLGVEGEFHIQPRLGLLFRYQHYSKSADGVETDWTQSFVNAGIRVKGVGAGLSYSSVPGASGTGVYVEFGDSGPGMTWFTKFDFVSINGAQAGALTFGLGFSIGG